MAWFFFSSRRRHTRSLRDWSSDVCSSDLLEQLGLRRMVALSLLGVISLTNALLLVALIGSLVEGKETICAQLLLKAVTVWGTNVIAFGLWYWGLDRGGPVKRLEPDSPSPDFQFPQMENPQLVEP